LNITDDGHIKTLDRFGQATVLIGENQSTENQLVMLNVMVEQIYSLSIEKPYNALNLPMGSETNLKIIFQEENARSFADKIIGINVFIQNSHPHVVKATLDYYNSTLNLNALGIGEANIKVLINDNIFDVIRVKVMSSVLPHSPVHLHIGGEVQFVFSEETSGNAKWSTDNSQVLSVDATSGQVAARSEGSAHVTYEGTVNLISIVNVKKVDRIELDDSTKPEYFTNSKNNKHYKDEHILLLNVYLEDALNEVFPETIINNKPLIKHNIKITCETPNYEIASAFSKIINNKYTCVLRPKTDRTPRTKIPNSIQIIVRAMSEFSTTYTREERLEIPFVSFLKVEETEKNLKFYSNQRWKSLNVISNNDFNVDVYGDSDVISYKILEKENENHFELQFTVPTNIKDDFSDLRVKISNPMTDESETFYLSFINKPKETQVDSENKKERDLTTDTQYGQDIEPKIKQRGGSGTTMVTYFVIVIGFVIAVYYFC
jgi:hypothetical protein